MVAKNTRNIALALVLVIGLTVLVGVLQNKVGLFSVTGGGDERESPDVHFDPQAQGCSVLSVSSIENAPKEMGAQKYYDLTADHSLTEFNGKVYSCK